MRNQLALHHRLTAYLLHEPAKSLLVPLDRGDQLQSGDQSDLGAAMLDPKHRDGL